jgi:hypothetical protein
MMIFNGDKAISSLTILRNVAAILERTPARSRL